MQIFLNGQPYPLPDGSNVSALIETLGLTGKRLALELNQEIVPRSRHDATVLQEGDRLELVHALGGG